MHIVPEPKKGSFYAGEFLPPGTMMIGVVREEGGENGALCILRQGMWAWCSSDQVKKLDGASAEWLKTIMKKYRLNEEEGAALAQSAPKTFEKMLSGEKEVSQLVARRLMEALHLI